MKPNTPTYIKKTPLPHFYSRSSFSDKPSSPSFPYLTPSHFKPSLSQSTITFHKPLSKHLTISSKTVSPSFITTLSHSQSFTPQHLNHPITFYSKLNNISFKKLPFQNSLIKNAFINTKTPSSLHIKRPSLFTYSKFLSRNNHSTINTSNPLHIEIRNPHFDYKSVYTKVRFKQVLGVSLSNKKLISRLYRMGVSP